MKNLPKHAHPTEQLIAHDLVSEIVGADCNISIWDGEEYAIKHSTDAEEILSAMSHTGEDILQIWDNVDPEKAYEGFIYLVYGNEPEYLVADYGGPWVNLIVQKTTEHYEVEK